MQKICFKMGEKRHVRLMVHAIDDAPFMIDCARWELLWAGNPVGNGECRITDHVMDAFILSPERRSSYTLAFTYVINDETLIEQLILEVA